VNDTPKRSRDSLTGELDETIWASSYHVSGDVNTTILSCGWVVRALL